MTSRILTPWWRRRLAPGPAGGEVGGGLAPTRILDWQHPRVAGLVAEIATRRPTSDRQLLQLAHELIADRIRSVYALNDAQPVSRTLARGRGSCSQRLAVLEAVARASGVPTRVRGLLLDGRFWYPRFPRLRHLVPDRVVLAWPEFALDGGWVPASELFGSLADLSDRQQEGFTNSDGETLFEALTRTAIDWDGATSAPGSCSGCDLSAWVVADLGRFEDRAALFNAHGQTLCRPDASQPRCK
ncbi:MAG: transglutaminase-like domain-containing protein [Pseudonocardiaceae bacterium]